MICVIGGAGYIGSHCVKRLLEKGYAVVTLDNLEAGHRSAVLGSEFVQGDYTDRQTLDHLFHTYPIECVMHFAAYASVAESMTDPAKFYRLNVVGGYTLLEAMRAHGIPYLIFSSSAATYGEPQQIPIREEHPQVPTNAYGETKRAFEQMLRWYDAAFGLRSISLRYFNAAGADPDGQLGEDHHPETHLIPLVLLTALGKRQAIKIFGTDYDTPDGTCIRDYIHVTDLADAHILAYEALKQGAPTTAYNLGNGLGYSVREVIRTAEQVVRHHIPQEEAPRRPGDPARLVASAERAQRELGWKPQYADLRIIIETAWRWHSTHPDGYGDRD